MRELDHHFQRGYVHSREMADNARLTSAPQFTTAAPALGEGDREKEVLRETFVLVGSFRGLPL